MEKEFRLLSWDSDCFGYTIGEILIKEMKRNEFDLLYNEFINMNLKLIYVYPLDDESYNVLYENNIPRIVNKITFYKYIGANNFEATSKISSYTHSIQFNRVLNLAFNSGEYSRFRLDKKFNNNEFEKLYTEWIENSINKKIADDVLVYKLDDDIKGFVTYKTEECKMVIGLIAIDDSFKGTGIGKALMKHVENIAHQTHKNLIEVSTQEENINAVKFYQHIGYKLKRLVPIFHLWIP